MPLMHCSKCHHEWESTDKERLCDWCGASGKVLVDKTSMEKVDWDHLLKRFNELSQESMKTGKAIITATQKKKRRYYDKEM